MIILWGPQLIQIYNDQYAVLMARKHPSGLGQPTRDCWPEVWHINEPIYQQVWMGETVTFEDALYPLVRSGVLEEVFITLTYSPLRDEEGQISGVLVTLFESTARILAERRRNEIEASLRTSEERQRFLLGLSDTLRPIGDPVEIQLVAARLLGQHLGANRVAYAEDGGDGETVVLARNYTSGVPGIEGIYRYADYGEELLRELRAGRPVIRPDIANDASLSEAEKNAHAVLQLGATLNVPLVKAGRLVAILAVHYIAAHEFKGEELALVREVAERTWAAVERSRAEADLRASEERFRQFGAASSDALWIRRAVDMRYEYVSSAFEHVYGTDVHRIAQGSGDADWIHSVTLQDRQLVTQCLAKVLRGEQNSCEYRIEEPNGSLRWVRDTVFPIRNVMGSVVRIGGIGQDITDDKETSQRLRVMVEELKHRTRNLLAIVQSVAYQTARSSQDMDDFQLKFGERLHTLGKVHDLLSKSDDRVITLRAVVSAELEAFATGDLTGRVMIEGPDICLRNSAVQMLALAIPELATNARKYGALSSSGGRLTVHWSVSEPGSGEAQLDLEWRETGVQRTPGQGTGHGYGRHLIEKALPMALGGRTDYKLSDDGLRCVLSMPLSKVMKVSVQKEESGAT